MARAMRIIEVVVLLFYLGCCGRPSHTNNQTMHPNDEPNQSFTVEFGEQGGFTGGYAGYIIDALGKVTKIDRLPGGESRKESLGVASGEDMASLRRRIDSIGFFRIAYRKRGNMTYSIVVRRNDEEHRVSWTQGDDDVPEDLIRLRNNLLNIVKKMN
jgi:hypothetical protein